MESEVIYSRYSLFLVGLSNGISSIYRFIFFQCKVKFKNVCTDTHRCTFSLLGGWCVARVFQFFVVSCEMHCDTGWEGEAQRGKSLLTVELKSKECFRLWKMASRCLAPDCEHSCFGKGSLEKVRCGQDGDFHIAAEDIHGFFSGLIARGWCTIISAHKLSTLILNSAPSICVCMSWAEASRMGQNTLDPQPNWWQRVWKVSLERPVHPVIGEIDFLSWASTQMLFFPHWGGIWNENVLMDKMTSFSSWKSTI